MMTPESFREFCEDETAKLVRLVPVPTGPLGFGRDLSCITDLTERMDEVDENSVQALGQALLRRLTTPRGSLPDDPSYGEDVCRMLNAATTQQDLNGYSGRVRAELLKDDRVDDVDARVTFAAGVLTVGVFVTPAVPGMDPFRLTLAVENGAVLLAEVSR